MNINEVYLCEEEDGKNPIKGFLITSCDIASNVRMIGSPVESGSTSFDNRVIEPVVVNIQGMCLSCDWQDVFESIKKMHDNRDWKFISVITKSKVISHLMLTKWDQKESNEKHDCIDITLEFIQVIDDAGQSLQSAKRRANASDSSAAPYVSNFNAGISN